MCTAFNSIPTGSPFDKSSLEAHITLLLKPSKDPKDHENYQPISLITTGVKLFAKILSHRIQASLSILIHLEHVGFIPGRENRDNTNKLINLLYWAKNIKFKPCHSPPMLKSI